MHIKAEMHFFHMYSCALTTSSVKGASSLFCLCYIDSTQTTLPRIDSHLTNTLTICIVLNRLEFNKLDFQWQFV